MNSPLSFLNFKTATFKARCSDFFKAEWSGLILLAIALLYNLILLAPEIQIGQVAPNDSVMHLVASERLLKGITNGEAFLDPWASYWVFGYPFWHTYQPLPSLIGAAVIALAKPFSTPAASFSVLQYLLISFVPLTFYIGARLFGLLPAAAGLAALLTIGPAEFKDFGWFGIGFAATTWRGCGLFTQLVAVNFFLPTLGLLRIALDTGARRHFAAIGLALSFLSHIVLGYVAFLSTVVLMLIGPQRERLPRLFRMISIFLPALLLLAWFIIPALLHSAEIHHSTFEKSFKWDSFGAPIILKALYSGTLLDGQRFPALTLLFFVGFISTLFSYKDPLARRLLALTLIWLFLYFGRECWGYLLILFAIPSDLHLHRFEVAFDIFAILLTAWGIERLLRNFWRSDRILAVLAALPVLVALIYISIDRAKFLADNAKWGYENLTKHALEQETIDKTIAEVEKILARRPGRVYSGPSAGWGNTFKVGSQKFHMLLMNNHIDNATFASHSMSHTSDLLFQHSENNGAQDIALGIRAVVAPANMEMPKHLKKRAVFGRFAVYESSPEGYFGLVSVIGKYLGPKSKYNQVSSEWMYSALLNQGQVVALGDTVEGVQSILEGSPLPPPQIGAGSLGYISSETRTGDIYQADYQVNLPAWALTKITWFPGLVAEVDGARVPLIKVTPGFAALPLNPGKHHVKVWYEPGPLKPTLFVLGLILFGFFVTFARRNEFLPRLEAAVQNFINRHSEVALNPRIFAYASFIALTYLALRPLFRGRYLLGHDANSYPQRLVEMMQALSSGDFPPLWAPDLACGHGMPLFQFAPPLLYLLGALFHMLGANLGNSLHFSLALLHFLAAAAVYMTARLWNSSRSTSVIAATAWLFAPYTSLDLYVRAAFAESSAVAVSPIALFAMLRLLYQPNLLNLSLSSIAIALIPLSHNAVALLVLPLLVFISAAYSLAERRIKPLIWSAFSIAGGLGLSAFFWLPAMMEKGYVKTELLRQDFLSWNQHSIELWQLFLSNWGFGFSLLGPNDGMSFAIGNVHLVFAILGILIAWRQRNRSRFLEILCLALIATLGAWLATSWSGWVWSRVEMLQYFAYPWRALMLPGLLLPILAIPFIESLTFKRRMIALVLILAFNLYHTEPSGYIDIDEQRFTPQALARSCMGTNTRQEYDPIWNKTSEKFWPNRLTGLDSQVTIRDSKVEPSKQMYMVSSEASTRVISSTFYYPNWTVYIDSEIATVTPAPESGMISFEMPAGEHRLEFRLLPTPLRQGALILSKVTLAAMLIAIAVFVWGPRRRKE